MVVLLFKQRGLAKRTDTLLAAAQRCVDEAEAMFERTQRLLRGELRA